jgi:hypothetical protein
MRKLWVALWVLAALAAVSAVTAGIVFGVKASKKKKKKETPDEVPSTPLPPSTPPLPPGTPPLPPGTPQSPSTPGTPPPSKPPRNKPPGKPPPPPSKPPSKPPGKPPGKPPSKPRVPPRSKPAGNPAGKPPKIKSPGPGMPELPPSSNNNGLVVAGKTYSAKQLDEFFGESNSKGKRFGELAAAMLADPQLVIRAWQAVTDDRSMYKLRNGIDGPFYSLGSNNNLCEFGASIARYGEPSAAWKRAVAESFGKNMLDVNGLIASSARRADPTGKAGWGWGVGYQFHFFRNRWQGQLGKSALGTTWPGGATGAGSRYVAHIFVDEYNFIKPDRPGQTSKTIAVHPEYGQPQGEGRIVARSVYRRIQNGKLEVLVGLALGWRDKTLAYHGAWDALCVLNQLFDANGASVLALISADQRKRVGSAMECLANNVNAKRDDGSGYSATGDESWERYRGLCAEELRKPGVQHVLQTFGRL